jgi:uncharacterized metal-binding protein YceD (DUF177 family)
MEIAMSDRLELSRPFDVQSLGGGEVAVEIVTTAEERAALARRFDLLSLDELRAEMRVSGSALGTVRVTGTMDAVVEQACVVTLDPLRSTLRGTIERSFQEVLEEDKQGGEIEVRVDDDAADPLVGGEIDLGEVVAEQLGLELDPFPRKPGAVFEPPAEETADSGEEPASPFAGLAALKKRLSDEGSR